MPAPATEERIRSLEGQMKDLQRTTAGLISLVSGSGKIMVQGKSLVVDSSIKVSEILARLKDLETRVTTLESA